MTHFVALVIGDNIEKQMLPYHEFECTGYDNEFIQEIDITEEALRESKGDLAEYYGYHEVTDLNDIDYKKLHKFGYILINDQDQVIKVVQRTNPNSQWDWWTIGGRWQDWLTRTDGLSFTSGPKSSIAFDLLRSNAEKTAGENWDNVHKFIAGRQFFTFTECEAKFANIREARDFYFEQSPVKEARKFSIWMNIDEFRDVSREDYITIQGKNSVVPYAYVKDGKWHQRDNLGKTEWAAQVNAMIESLSDDTLITVVDCHC